MGKLGEWVQSGAGEHAERRGRGSQQKTHDKEKPFRWDVRVGTIEVLQTELGMLSDHGE